MPKWNPKRNPDKYPGAWHEIVRAAPGRYLVLNAADEKEAKDFMYKFNAFKACLRTHSLHQTAFALKEKQIRLEVEREKEMVFVWANVSRKGKLLELLEKAMQDG